MLHCSHAVHRRIPVNKLCISIRCRFSILRYDFPSSLKERSRQRRLKNCSVCFQDNPRRLGKDRDRLVWPGPSEVGSKDPAGRQDSPVPLACSLMPNANEGLGGQERLRNRSQPGQVAQAGFEPEGIAVTQRVNGCYCAPARGARLWRIRLK